MSLTCQEKWKEVSSHRYKKVIGEVGQTFGVSLGFPSKGHLLPKIFWEGSVSPINKFYKPFFFPQG
jgi:hypothetical protein